MFSLSLPSDSEFHGGRDCLIPFVIYNAWLHTCHTESTGYIFLFKECLIFKIRMVSLIVPIVLHLLNSE